MAKDLSTKDRIKALVNDILIFVSVEIWIVVENINKPNPIMEIAKTLIFLLSLGGLVLIPTFYISKYILRNRFGINLFTPSEIPQNMSQKTQMELGVSGLAMIVGIFLLAILGLKITEWLIRILF